MSKREKNLMLNAEQKEAIMNSRAASKSTNSSTSHRVTLTTGSFPVIDVSGKSQQHLEDVMRGRFGDRFVSFA